MIQEAIKTIVKGSELPFETARESMGEIMSGKASEAQIGAFLAALSLKGETVGEITGFARAMRDACVPVSHEGEVFEIVGTGGDGADTFNISTTSGFVIASGGVAVAKHGNRSVSSRCGAADCLEALGVNLALTGKENTELLKKAGMCFMCAPVYHSSMKYAAPVRKALGFRTVFNILGPLGNPAGATMQLMGVYEEKLVEPMAKVLSNLGVKRGAVVYGMDGLDEITACDRTLVCEFKNGLFQKYLLDPRDYGMELAHPGDLKGGDSRENAEITRTVLSGEKGPKRNAVLLNAGMSFHLAEGMSLAEGIQKAADLIDSGKALAFMERFIRLSREAAQ